MKKREIETIPIKNFSYELPEERIAKYPLRQRDTSKLLCYENGAISSATFHQLPGLIPEESLLLFNNTRVIHARLLFQKPTGATIEVFCLSPCAPADYTLNFSSHEACVWHCMIGNAKRWKNEALKMHIETQQANLTLTAEKVGVSNEETLVKFSWNNPNVSFSEVLELAGILPIPPYMNRPTEEKDKETYQTVYAHVEGSVAAPTAGLHFTEKVLQELCKKNIKTAEVTLHVGAGTFKPVKSENIGEHSMHTEIISVSRKTVELLANNKKPLIVVGTTSMRTVESLYYIGKKLGDKKNEIERELFVSQWEPYINTVNTSPKEALRNILRHMQATDQQRLVAATQIMIAPGYSFHYTDAIITNFHQPQSTLLLLIAAFVGEDWKKIYNYALEHDYRFLSYGDSSLLWQCRP